jgi:hypothetical protein
LLPSREAAVAAAAPVPDTAAEGAFGGPSEVPGLPGPGAESGARDGQLEDLEVDTIVPHSKDEDLPIFADLESEWFLRREEAALPPPPGLPLEEWGISLEDLPATAPSLAGAAGSGQVAAAGEARPEPAAARNGVESQPARPAASSQPPPLLPVRQPRGTGEPARSLGPLGPGEPPRPGRTTWVSPADEGWRAAERLSNPNDGGTTDAGLPIRVPMAHFVPGAAPTPLRQSAAAQARGQAASQTQSRSPDAVRGMLSSYQRGLRQGREAGRHREKETDETYANQEHS